MESMTGYAFKENTTDQFSYSVEIKSLNSRYLEVFVNLPRILKNEEIELASSVKKHFSRGKIELNIEVFDWSEKKPVSINEDLIKDYYTRLRKVQKDLKAGEHFAFGDLFALEGVTHRERTSLSEKSRNDIYMTLGEVIKKAIKMRRAEGASTKKDLMNSIKVITESMAGIKKAAAGSSKERAHKIKKRIGELAGVEIDETRLYTEIAILADKLDINEETVRLKDHLAKFKEVMKEEGQIGRKLDFIAQEIFREINTIASKSSSSEVSHLAVDVKNHVDKIREQCRNIV